MTQLILKRASASRPSGHWYDDDYDVLCEGEVVGRIESGRGRRTHERAEAAGIELGMQAIFYQKHQ
jgi:hypothetical protein